MLRFAMLGSGNGARAWCAQISAAGYPIVMWEPLDNVPDFPTLHEKKTISLVGDIQVTGHLHAVTRDIKEAMDGASIVVVNVPSFAHGPIFEKMIPFLKDGQHIVIVPGNFGAYRLKTMMSKMGCKARISISTVETQPYACRICAVDKVNINKRKTAIYLATSPASAAPEILDILNSAFAGYVKYKKADHILALDMSNINFTMHPYPVILNWGAIEQRGDTWRHYIDGITPLISEQMHELDKERIAIGAACGFKLAGFLELMKMYYGNNSSKNIFEYVHSPETPYSDLVGQSVRSRYITEDVPGVIMPIACIARKAGTRSPRADLIVNFCSQLHGTDYWHQGTTLESIGIADKSIDEIINMLA